MTDAVDVDVSTVPTAAPPKPDENETAGPDAFISYSHVDRAFAVRLRDALAARGKVAWLDETEIRGGTRWSDALQSAIQTADAFLFLLSPHSAASRECGAELEHALRLNKRILPVRVADTPLDALPPGLGDYQFIPSRRVFAEEFDAALDQLITEIETDRDWVREHTEWSEKAVEWERRGHDRSYLLGGAELETAEAWRSRAAGKRPGLSTLQSEYIDASRRWATRRLRRTRSAVSVALVVALGLSVVAFILRQQAVSNGQLATSGELSANSLLDLGSDPQKSLRLAVHAADVRQTPAALDALRSAIPQNHLVRSFSHDSQQLLDGQWSADGSLVLTASQDGYARLYDAATGRVIRQFPISRQEGGRGARFADHDHWVVTWGDSVMHVWDLRTGAQLARMSDPGWFQLGDVEVSPDGTTIATAAGPGAGGTSLLWDGRTGRLLHVLMRGAAGQGQLPQNLSFSSDGRLIAGGSQNGMARVWDTRTGQLVRWLQLQKPNGPRPYVEVSFSPNGKLLATAQADISNNGRTVIWNVANWTHSSVDGIEPAWSLDSQHLATVLPSGSGYVYSANSNQTVTLKGGAPVASTFPPVFGPSNGSQSLELVTGSTTGQATVWNALNGSVIETLAGDAGAVVPVGFGGGGSGLLTWSSDGSARIWDSGRVAPTPASAPRAVRGTLSSDFQQPEFSEGPDPLSPLRAIGSLGTKSVIVENVRTGAQLDSLRSPSRSFSAIAFDDAGRTMLVMGSLTTASTRQLPAELRSVKGHRLLHVLSGPGSRAVGGVFSPDGRLVAAVDAHDDIGVWDVASGRQLTVFRRHEGHNNVDLAPGAIDVRFSPDGTLILSADPDGQAFVWRARTGAVLNAIKGDPMPPSGQYEGMGGAISPDDRYVVVVRSWDNDAYVYRVGRPALVTQLAGHALGIEDAAFNPDGSLIATVSDDDTARVWDLQHSSPLLTLPYTNRVATRVEFSTDGRSLITDLSSPYATLPCDICGGFPALLRAAKQREIHGSAT